MVHIKIVPSLFSRMQRTRAPEDRSKVFTLKGRTSLSARLSLLTILLMCIFLFCFYFTLQTIEIKYCLAPSIKGQDSQSPSWFHSPERPPSIKETVEGL